MKYDEFAFFNQQLAAMLRDGIPLEGALGQLCANMRRGELRTELERLEADLKNGTPLPAALAARKLPEFYVQMLQVGVQAGDLPGVLVMLADYYQRADTLWTRLKGLMLYPLLVLIAAFALSCFFTVIFRRVFDSNFMATMGIQTRPILLVSVWAPPILIGLILAGLGLILMVPSARRSLRWRVPAFKEARLSQLASAMGLMLKTGGNLNDALGVVQKLEAGTPASRELAQWQQRLAGGRGNFPEMAESGKAFPPLFRWLVGNAGEDLAGGFQRASEIYSARAVYQSDLFLHAVLPLSVLLLGAMILGQVFPLARTFAALMNGIGG